MIHQLRRFHKWYVNKLFRSRLTTVIVFVVVYNAVHLLAAAVFTDGSYSGFRPLGITVVGALVGLILFELNRAWKTYGQKPARQRSPNANQ